MQQQPVLVLVATHDGTARGGRGQVGGVGVRPEVGWYYVGVLPGQL